MISVAFDGGADYADSEAEYFRMLTVMCPNCRHRFPAPGCCNPVVTETPAPSAAIDSETVMNKPDLPSNNSFYGGGYLLVPREYSMNSGGCFINAPTIIHGPTIIQQPMIHKVGDQRGAYTNDGQAWKTPDRDNRPDDWIVDEMFKNNVGALNVETKRKSPRMGDCHINTTCDLTGGTVTITTPSIQSGGCLIQSTDSGIIVQAPRIEIRPKLSGGGCFVQKQLSTDEEDTSQVIYRDRSRLEGVSPSVDGLFDDVSNFDGTYTLPPSGCQELPGIRRCAPSMKANSEAQQRVEMDSTTKIENPNGQAVQPPVETSERDPECWRHPAHRDGYLSQQQPQQHRNGFCNSVIGSEIKKRHSTCCCGSTTREEGPSGANSVTNPNRPISSTAPIAGNSEKSSLPVDGNGSMEIRVNATVQLPPNIGHCTVNIIATTGNPGGADVSRTENNTSSHGRPRNNFNGGGLVQVDGAAGALGNDSSGDRREEAPTTPLSWLTPCPWGFENYLQDKDYTRIAEVKRLLQTSGWYHEGLSWQQSENLLKNSPVGSWLMRDSSDSRFVFAVSVQTTRGPTSVRVHYYLGKFRLDAEPRLSHAMPVFDCPIKMLEHYVEYSKRVDEHRKEVWVDYSGQIYSQIYLTKPLVKEVSSLSHLARLVVNRNKLSNDNLPPLIKNYLAEYPYSL